MGDLSETLWYQDDQGGWYTGWGALTKGKFVLWMGGGQGAMAIPGTDSMFRADLSQLSFAILPSSPASGEEQGPAQRYSKCFHVRTVSGSWEAGGPQTPDHKLIVAAVDESAHLKWKQAFLAGLPECMHQDHATDDLEKQAEVLESQPDSLFEDVNDLDRQDPKNGAAVHASGAEHRDTKGQQTTKALPPFREAELAKAADPIASDGDGDTGSPLPEMLKLVLRGSEKKPSAVQVKGGLEPGVAAVLAKRCPELLTSIGRVRHEIYQQSRKQQDCDLMVAVHHLKMLHAIVLSTDIETQRHSSSEAAKDWASLPHASRRPEDSRTSAPPGADTLAADEACEGAESEAVKRAAKCLHKLDHDISHLLTKLSVLSTADMSAMARAKSGAMLIRDFCDNTAVVASCKVERHPLSQSLGGCSAVTGSSAATTLGELIDRDSGSVRDSDVVEDSDREPSVTDSPNDNTPSNISSRVLPGAHSHSSVARASRTRHPPDLLLTSENSNGGTEGARGLGSVPCNVQASNVRVLKPLQGAYGGNTNPRAHSDSRDSQSDIESDAYLKKLAKGGDTNQPLVGASRLPYMSYWMQARAI